MYSLTAMLYFQILWKISNIQERYLYQYVWLLFLFNKLIYKIRMHLPWESAPLIKGDQWLCKQKRSKHVPNIKFSVCSRVFSFFPVINSLWSKHLRTLQLTHALRYQLQISFVNEIIPRFHIPVEMPYNYQWSYTVQWYDLGLFVYQKTDTKLQLITCD